MSMSDGDDLELARLLADPSLWADPGAAMEDEVVAAIRAEAGAAPPIADLVSRARRRRWSTHVGAGLVGAAAAAVIAVVIVRVAGDDTTPSTTAGEAGTTVQLAGTELAPGFTGTAEVSTQRSGVLIRLRVPGLPRREGGDFYEGWLISCDGERVVPIGTFHDMDRTAGWAGVDVEDYPLLAVTTEEASGPEGQGPSGDVVVSGSIATCP